MQHARGHSRCTARKTGSMSHSLFRGHHVSRHATSSPPAAASRHIGVTENQKTVKRLSLRGTRGCSHEVQNLGRMCSKQTRPAAVAATEQQPAAATQEVKEESKPEVKKPWYALVANAEFYFNDVQNESLAEQLRERVRYFKEQKKEIDFWLIPDPTWLDEKFSQEAAQVRRPCCALVSTDKQWIQFMKLRLDRVLWLDLGTVDKSEVLRMGAKLPQFKKPTKWTAPYSMYAPNWWEVFYP